MSITAYEVNCAGWNAYVHDALDVDMIYNKDVQTLRIHVNENDHIELVEELYVDEVERVHSIEVDKKDFMEYVGRVWDNIWTEQEFMARVRKNYFEMDDRWINLVD